MARNDNRIRTLELVIVADPGGSMTENTLIRFALLIEVMQLAVAVAYAILHGD
jgi:hypothetical protein